MDKPTRRLDQSPSVPAPQSCLRCETPMFEALIETYAATGNVVKPYGLRLKRLIKRSPLLGEIFSETPCAVWVCPTCGYTELRAADPAALLNDKAP